MYEPKGNRKDDLENLLCELREDSQSSEEGEMNLASPRTGKAIEWDEPSNRVDGGNRANKLHELMMEQEELGFGDYREGLVVKSSSYTPYVDQFMHHISPS